MLTLDKKVTLHCTDTGNAVSYTHLTLPTKPFV